MTDVLGIDLGTTNSCVATVGDNGQPIIISGPNGRRVVPSFVAIRPDGSYVVGDAAVDESLARPDGVVYGTKRLMGRTLESPQVAQMVETVPYTIVPGPSQEALVKVEDHVWSPEDVASVILGELKERATQSLGREVTKAVITVPAHFDNNQRVATRTAAERAGLSVLSLINEPTAAALAYGWATKAKAKIAVYDLGGGTFDITILQMGDGVYDVLATGGETFLGGNDFDNRIAIHLVRNHIVKRTLQPLNPLSMLRLRAAAEQAKIALSAQTQTEIRLGAFLDIPELQVPLTRAQLQEMTRDLITQTINVCRETLEAAGVKPFELNGVLMVGGQTRMPAIQAAAKAFFLREPNQALNPDESVAAGAALHAASLAAPEPTSRLEDVTPLTLGIASVYDTFAGVIPAHTKVPCTITKVFSTVRDNQDSVQIVVLQGESQRASQNSLLGAFLLKDIAPAPRMVPQIEVTFEIDESGILNVSARDKATGKEQQISVQGFSSKEEALGQVEDPGLLPAEAE